MMALVTRGLAVQRQVVLVEVLLDLGEAKKIGVSTEVDCRRGGSGDSDGRDRKCFNCMQEGHRSNECPCQKLWSERPSFSECPNPPKLQLDRLDKQRKPFIPKGEDVELLNKEHIEQGELFTKLFEAENCGYKSPTTIQQYAIPAIFKGIRWLVHKRDLVRQLLPFMTTLIRTNNLCEMAERTCPR
ncbi:unnamed protein product [Cylicocyclus nassatus]|uniref:CCHC-type domain-containing protein n=1 Tax=Cylicocyclus nassatus TaxID=53992 RepID=A0AA36DQX2_CYLNA|nr:unnamed protein product [Cylicocyclus nassatus]